MVAFLDSVSIQVYISNNWLDISEYIVQNIQADWGILNNSPVDRLGYVGGMTIYLNNNSGIFTPNTVGTLSGWKAGIKVRLVLTYEGVPYVKFKGRIKKIGLPYEVDKISVVPVTVSDWFDEAINKKFYLQSIETDKTTAKAVQTVLANVSTQPDNVDIEDSSEILDAVFTTTDSKATAYSELSKLALSEFSYIYLRKDRVNGETLKVEKRQSRIGRQLAESGKPKASSPLFLLQNGSYLLLQNGSRLLLNDSASMTFDSMYQMETEYGENLINQLTVRNNPITVDTELKILFELDAPIPIGAGQTLPDLKVSYKDPTGGGGRVNGTNMQELVAGQGYRMSTLPDGTGTDISSYLTFTAEFGSSGAIYRNLTNISGLNGYITRLRAVGYGVYTDNPIEVSVEDATSIDDYGIKPFLINNHYQSDLNITKAIAALVLGQNKDNNVLPRKIRLRANLSPEILLSFLSLDVGDLLHVKQDKHQIDENYFIHSVKFTILQGGIIEFEWGLTDAYLADRDFWRLGVIGKSELGTTTVVSF